MIPPDFDPLKLLEMDPLKVLKIDPASIPNLWQDLDQFQASLASIHESLSDPRERRLLGDLLTDLQKSREEAEVVLPAFVEELQQGNNEMKSWVVQFKSELEQKHADFEAKLQEAAEAATVAALPPEPALEAPLPVHRGAALGAELLQRFGRIAPLSKDQVELEGSVWEDDYDQNLWGSRMK